MNPPPDNSGELYYKLDKLLHDVFYKGLNAGEDTTLQYQFERELGYKTRYIDRCIKEARNGLADLITSQVSEQVERAKIKWLDEQVAHVLFDIYPEEVFTPSTAEDKKRVAEIDQDFVTRLHCDGIRHGLHILRREVRGLSARDDLAALHKQSSKLNTPKE